MAALENELQSKVRSLNEHQSKVDKMEEELMEIAKRQKQIFKAEVYAHRIRIYTLHKNNVLTLWIFRWVTKE